MNIRFIAIWRMKKKSCDWRSSSHCTSFISIRSFCLWFYFSGLGLYFLFIIEISIIWNIWESIIIMWIILSFLNTHKLKNFFITFRIYEIRCKLRLKWNFEFLLFLSYFVNENYWKSGNFFAWITFDYFQYCSFYLYYFISNFTILFTYI